MTSLSTTCYLSTKFKYKSLLSTLQIPQSHSLNRVVAHAGVSALDSLSEILASLVPPHQTGLSSTSQRDLLQLTQLMYSPLMNPFYLDPRFCFYKTSVSRSCNIFDLIAVCLLSSDVSPMLGGVSSCSLRSLQGFRVVLCIWLSFPEYPLNE